MEICEPRTNAEFFSIRRPSNIIAPSEIKSGGSIRPKTDEPVIDFPAPDSPTSPTISPGYTFKDILSKIICTFLRCLKTTLKF